MVNMYTEKKINKIVNAQKKYFKTGVTLDVDFRIRQLEKLKNNFIAYESEFINALKEDLGRSETEAYLCDIGPVISELNETLKGIRKWSRREVHFSGLMCFPSIFTYVYKMPYGTVLVISPFNFPILLTLGVLIACLSAGNTVVLKTSSKSKACTKVLKKFIEETFEPQYVTLIDGGHDVADMCLNENFDKVFYTGSPQVAKHVMELSSKNLTPVALELGGENGNWAIVRKDANLKDAAKKIAFFKLLNAGQICINVNQIAVSEEVADTFIEELKRAFILQIGTEAIENVEYPKLINEKAYDKCAAIVKKYKDKVVFGGNGNKNTQKYNPTIIYPVKINDELVQKELFSPILPIVVYKDNEIDKLLEKIEEREHPLAFYLFTKDIKWAKKVMSTHQYGGGCINEVCMHMMVKGVPFNGVGHSGMGAYHGHWGFDEFSHPTTVLKGNTMFNLPLRLHPYNSKKYKLDLIKKFEK